ncbi:MAG: hypothetical protein P8181_03530 [bacterium]
MKPYWVSLASALIALGTLASCGWDGSEDLTAPTQGIENAPLFEDLSEKDDVLTNLQLAYDIGDQTQFARLLDQSFVFSFSERDIFESGLPEQWDRNAELQVLPNLFGSPTPTGILTTRQIGDSAPAAAAVEDRTWGYIKYYFAANPSDSVSGMSLALNYTAGDANWAPFTEPGTGETWYEKEADYVLTVETKDGMQFEALDGHAAFAVREIPGMGIWRLVRWSDDASIFADLSDKDDVLHNLEWSYNLRNLLQFNKLIDDDFVFFFSLADFSQGLTPEMWDRSAELAATSHLFDPSFPPDPVISIDLTLTYPPDDWTAVIPPGHPGETWYQKPVMYNFVVQTASMTYMAVNTEMTVTIRFTDAVADSTWRMVTWFDETDLQGTARGDGPSGSPIVDAVTWGRLKALYFE